MKAVLPFKIVGIIKLQFELASVSAMNGGRCPLFGSVLCIGSSCELLLHVQCSEDSSHILEDREWDSGLGRSMKMGWELA